MIIKLFEEYKNDNVILNRNWLSNGKIKKNNFKKNEIH